MAPWSRPLEVERLADDGADIDVTVPLGELSGLRSVGEAVGGSVCARVRFWREQGVAVAELSLRGSAMLKCQRCMGAMELPLETLTRVALIGSEAEVGRVPDDFEPVLAAGGRISLGELVTEELLLTLPIVPLHEPGTDCVDAPAAAAEPGQSGVVTHRPFARLGELLKR